MPLHLASTFAFHLGALDGSAGVAIAKDAFIGVSDEFNVLQRHRTQNGGQAADLLDLNRDFEGFPTRLKKGSTRESDIESAARVGNVVYWIGSHGCDSDGEPCPERQVLFATRLKGKGAKTRPEPYGKVYQGLLEDLIDAAALKKFPLRKASRITPKDKGGLNIESLCAEHESTRLFIGFRNPIPKGKALIVPLKNASRLIRRKSSQRAEFDPPILLDLKGRGLRDMVWWRDSYLIIGGHFDEHMADPSAPKPRLFRWDGKVNAKGEATPKMLDLDLAMLNPEGLIVFSNTRLLIVSDDGAFEAAPGKKQKDELKDGDKTLAEVGFRSVWLTA